MVAIRSTAAAVGLPSRAAVVSPAPGIPACTATWKSAAASARLGDSGIRNRSHHCVGSLRRACLGPLAEGRPKLSRRWRGPDHHHRREHTRHHDNRSQHDIPDDHTRRELPRRCVRLPRRAAGRKLQGVRDKWGQNFVRVCRGSSDRLRKLRCRRCLQHRVRT